MLRRIVTVYLMLVLMAGPGLCCCCCIFSQAVAAAAVSTNDSAEPKPSGCCSCCAEEPASCPPASTKEDSPRPVKRECPCRQNLEFLLVAVPAPVSVLADQASFLFVEFLPALSPGFVPASFHSNPGDSLLPFLTAQDLLRAHHQLRC